MIRGSSLSMGWVGALALAACEAPVLPSVHLPEGGFGGANGGTEVGTGNGGSVPSGSETTSGGAAGEGGNGGITGEGGLGGTGNGTAGSAGLAGFGTDGGGGTGDAGRDGAIVTDDSKTAVAVLDGWRYEYRCGYVDGHSLTDGTCSSGEICWPNASKARFSEKKMIAIAGDAARTYEVVLRIRGVIEPRDYPVACSRLAQDPTATIGIAEQCDGFANQQQVTFNVYEFKIADPPHVYYLNSVPVHPPHRVDPIDMQWTIRVKGRSTITFTMDDLNGGEVRNCSLVVPGIPPAPNRFDGNFFQLNVVSARILL